MDGKTEAPWRVLVVAADERLRDLLMTTFDDGKFGFLVADTADMAKSVARDGGTAVVLGVGSHGPTCFWIDVAETLRSDPTLQQVPIVGVGFESESEGRRLAVQVGANAYFRLPFSPLELLGTVNRMLGSR